MNSVADIWANILVQLKQDLSETTIATWFDELEAVDIRGNTFYLHCANDFKKGYIESLFLKNIKAALRDIFSTDFEVSILDDDGFAEFKGPAEKKRRTVSPLRSSPLRLLWWARPTNWPMRPPWPWQSTRPRITTLF